MKRDALFFLVLILLLACRNPLHETEEDRAVLRVRAAADTDVARTVVADFSSQINDLTVSLTSNDGYATPSPQTDTGAPWQVSFSVPPGSWNIAVVARRGGVQVASGGPQTVVLKSGLADPVTIPLVFGAASAKGDMRFAIRFPATLGIDYVQGKIEETGTLVEPVLSTEDGWASSVLSFSPLPTGTYSFVLTFRRGHAKGTVAGIFREKIVVVGGFTSASWAKGDGTLAAERVFGAEEFWNNNTKLANFTLNGGTLCPAFNPAIFGYYVACASFSGLSFTATCCAGQSLTYQKNAGGFTTINPAEQPINLSVSNSDAVSVLVTAPDRTTQSAYRFSFGPVAVITLEVPGGHIIFTESGGNLTLFGHLGNPTSVSIPDKIEGHPVTGIGENAFMRCASLISINLPNSITTIGKHAFLGCSSLTSLVIPELVTTITEGSIQNCTYLTTVVIPASVTTIQLYAFYNSPSLTELHVRAENVPELSSDHALTGGALGFKIFVPTAKVDNYQAASVWKKFAGSIVGE